MYLCISISLTNKEGEELQSPLQTGESTATKDKRCPPHGDEEENKLLLTFERKLTS